MKNLLARADRLKMPNLPHPLQLRPLRPWTSSTTRAIRANLGQLPPRLHHPRPFAPRTKWKRAHTHFAPPVRGKSRRRRRWDSSIPTLTSRMPPAKSPATRAFIAGYLSHLVTDENLDYPDIPPLFSATAKSFFRRNEGQRLRPGPSSWDMDRKRPAVKPPAWTKLSKRLHDSDRYVRVGLHRPPAPSTPGKPGWPKFCAPPLLLGTRLHFLARRRYKNSPPRPTPKVQDFS